MDQPDVPPAEPADGEPAGGSKAPRPLRRAVARWGGRGVGTVVLLALLGAGGVAVETDRAGQVPTGSLPVGTRPGAPSSAPSGPAPQARPLPVEVARMGGWSRTWQTAVQPPPPGSVAAAGIGARTVRMRVHTSVGGSALRLTLSNVYGDRPLEVAGVTIGLPERQQGSLPDAVPGSLHALTVGGSRSVTIPVGGQVTTDAALLDVPARTDLLVSVALSGFSVPLTGHAKAVATSWLSEPGDHTSDTGGTAWTAPVPATFVVTALDVVTLDADGRPAPPAPTVVAFGDSITDGVGSSFDAERRWPDGLARLLPTVAVANAGISGNRVLRDTPRSGDAAVNRFDRDVLEVPGARVVVVLEGINDIQQPPPVHDPQAVVRGLSELADRAHARGLKVVLGTLTPYHGWSTWTERGEATRQAVNDWIRTRAVPEGKADAVVDFDAAVRDPADPRRLLPAMDCGDHIHPNDTGYAAMAAEVLPVVEVLAEP